MMKDDIRNITSEGLIETWDVLKSRDDVDRIFGQYGLIETWDVLKCPLRLVDHQHVGINRNMGCIEIGKWRDFNRRSDLINRNMGCIEIKYRRRKT